jgi:hypothetical protein
VIRRRHVWVEVNQRLRVPNPIANNPGIQEGCSPGADRSQGLSSQINLSISAEARPRISVQWRPTPMVEERSSPESTEGDPRAARSAFTSDAAARGEALWAPGGIRGFGEAIELIAEEARRSRPARGRCGPIKAYTIKRDATGPCRSANLISADSDGALGIGAHDFATHLEQ